MFELEHCEKLILLNYEPNSCPICRNFLTEKNFKKINFNDLLVSSNLAKNCFIIKPTNGSFKNYKLNQDLHIGFTDNDGNLIEFNEAGLRYEKIWPESYILYSIDSLMKELGYIDKLNSNGSLLLNYWNYTIKVLKENSLVKKQFNTLTYDSEINNCLDFVLFFIKMLNLDLLNNKTKNKNDFCKNLIQPKIRKLFILIGLNNCVTSNRFIIF